MEDVLQKTTKLVMDWRHLQETANSVVSSAQNATKLPHLHPNKKPMVTK